MRELPRKTDPSGLELALEADDAVGAPYDSATEIRAPAAQVVANAIEDQTVRAAIQAQLVRPPRRLALAGVDAVRRAAVVVVDARADAAAAVARIRLQARSDAAIIVVFDHPEQDLVASAHAAGAFACVRLPCRSEDLHALVSSALEVTAAKVQVADLTRQLDLHAHLAAIGRISAGLSHELGNPLAAALLGLYTVRSECARLLEARDLLRSITQAPEGEVAVHVRAAREKVATMPDDSNLNGALEDVTTSHQRIQALLSNLRALVGNGHVRVERVDLGKMIEDVRRWAAQTLQGVEVEQVGEPLTAVADRTLLGQILVNLTTNAALAAKSLSSPRVRFHVYGSGPYAVVSVRDNGPGISEDVKDKLFEPFFTTRRGRGGMGLGLALCREYARQMGAEVSFWSTVGRGACFRVRLPAAPR
jgi:signal transduction histidine kinase